MTIDINANIGLLKEGLNVTIEDRIAWHRFRFDNIYKTTTGEFLFDKMFSEFDDKYPDEFSHEAQPPAKKYLTWENRVGRFLSEGIGNAGMHGNHRNDGKFVSVIRNYAENKALYEIQDEGEGFDVKATYNKFKSKNPTYHRNIGGGTGFILFDAYTDMLIIYNTKGNIMYFQYLANKTKKCAIKQT